MFNFQVTERFVLSLFSLLFTEELRLPFDSLPLDSAALDFVETILE